MITRVAGYSTTTRVEHAEPAETRHRDVQQQHVRGRRPDQLDRLVTVLCYPDELDARKVFDEPGDSCSDQPVILGKPDSDRGDHASASVRLHGAPREPRPERRAFGERRLDGHSTADQRDLLCRPEQAEPVTWALEREAVRLEADAVVADRQNELAGRCDERDLDAPMRPRDG